MEKISIYTDGACKGNPGVGGFGALIIINDKEVELCGANAHTTNQRMELTAAIEAINYVAANGNSDINILLYSDSKYLIQGITQWIISWKKNGWKNSAKKAVVNQDLWQQLDILNNKFNISWQWVKGHANNTGNIKADQLANLGINNFLAKS